MLKSTLTHRQLRALSDKSAIRSDIRYHLLLEEHLYTAFSTLDVSATEAEIILKMISEKPADTKKRRFGQRKPSPEHAAFFLRRLVRTQLNYLLIKANLENLRDDLSVKITDQQDIHSVSYAFPEALNAKALSPAQAINSLNELLTQVESQLLKLNESLKKRQQLLQDWLSTIREKAALFFDQASIQKIKLTDALSTEQKNEFIRVISGITPATLLKPMPDKTSPDYPLFQEIKKLTSRRGRSS